MKAVVVQQGETEPTVVEIDEPTPDPGEALLRTLRVGIDGTDHEVIEGNHGGFPDGDDYQVLGHEAVAVVADANGTDLNEGQLVVPTVRRPREEGNEYFERGEPDMAPDGQYVERGIVGAHGYMAEYFTSAPRYLVPVPDAFAESGFLVEPISNTEKALEHAHATRSAFEWTPETGLVLGNGPLGLLTLAMLEGGRTDFSRTYCLGRRDRPDPTIDIIERLGATYVDSRETPVSVISEVHEPMDFVYEATGYAKHAFETVHALRSNGVGALLGIPEDWTFEIDGGALHRELVLQNKALFGSVNSNVRHYEAAIDSLSAFPDWLVDDLVTGVHEPAAAPAAFETNDETIKTVVEFDTV
ncbi:glucose 1-dehydrogenase [Halococcus saccharolyticus]|uniref:Glucose 1-dehydrogenase n=1 Tax=Halococcus saccharolyticus DSM 5350 TaxID=1227455 RepID=M0MRR3_9EURY|nr:glucose 1-dehydrogenase [Halococcus saccharolyticus]EMA47429.1 Alcohol dehydrogenase GroES domain protein [Halococcus saccharolyticus DSM 5350]